MLYLLRERPHGLKLALGGREIKLVLGHGFSGRNHFVLDIAQRTVKHHRKGGFLVGFSLHGGLRICRNRSSYWAEREQQNSHRNLLVHQGILHCIRRYLKSWPKCVLTILIHCQGVWVGFDRTKPEPEGRQHPNSQAHGGVGDRKSTRLNSSHLGISYA